MSKKFSNYNDVDVINEIDDFIKNIYSFTEFYDYQLSDGIVSLVMHEKREADHSKKFVPSYVFYIYVTDIKVGYIDIRIGYTESLYYGGHIGYAIDPAHRGNGYAGRACKLILEVARKHKMNKISISNEHNNNESIRVCQKINAQFIRTVVLPPDNNMRLEDSAEAKNIWIINL